MFSVFKSKTLYGSSLHVVTSTTQLNPEFLILSPFKCADIGQYKKKKKEKALFFSKANVEKEFKQQC